jgi:thiocyanate desulfurase
MVPMAELLVERGQIPGDSPHTLTGLDNAVHDPRGRYSILTTRMCGGVIVIDRKNDFKPICYLYAPEDNKTSNFPVTQVSDNPDTWEIKLKTVGNPVHEAGFNPAGDHFVIMNNLRANNVAVFNVADADPTKWKRETFVRDDEWRGEYPSPFHLCFSRDGSKCFFSVLHPKPAKSDVVVVETKTWTVIKKFREVGVDCQTMHITYDGKYVLQIFSGFQRMESGVFVFRQDTLDPVGYMPNFGGHHDCVVVPNEVGELKWSRCCTV